MKLHLPKLLYLAVFACFVAPASWSDTTITQNTEWGADVTATTEPVTVSGEATFTVKAQTLDLTNGGITVTEGSWLDSHYDGGNNSGNKVKISGGQIVLNAANMNIFAAEHEIADLAIIGESTMSTRWGYGAKISQLSGDADAVLNISTTDSQYRAPSFVIEGDGAYAGTIRLLTPTTGFNVPVFTINSAGAVNQAKVELSTGTQFNATDAVVSNLSSVTLANDSSFIYSTAETNVNSIVSALSKATGNGNIVIDNNGVKTLSGDVTISNGGTVTFRGGSLGASDAAITNAIKSENSTVIAFENIDAYIGADKMRVSGLWVIGDGAHVRFTTSDVFHWDDNLNLKVLTGGVLDLQGRQSVKDGSSIILAGGTLTGTGANNVNGDSRYYGLDFFNGGTITTLEDSRIETNIGGHDAGNDAAIKFDVAADKTLTMTGSLVGGRTGNSFEKSNSGTMVYSGEALTHALIVSGGVFEYKVTEGERAHTGNITGAGTLRKSGGGELKISGTVGTDSTALGKLEVNAGKVTLSNTAYIAATSGSGVLNIAEGTTSISGSYAVLNTVVGEDATLKFASSNDLISWRTHNIKMTLNGGTLELGTGRQSLGSGFELILNNGKVIGSNTKASDSDVGDDSDGDDLGALDFIGDVEKNGRIVSTGSSSIVGGIRMRSDVEFDVQDGTLTVDSILNGNGINAGIVKKGAGTLVLTLANTYREGLYTGNTIMENGAIKYDIEGTHTYTGTITGKGNIIKAGTGNITIAAVSSLDGDITVSGGNMTITNLTISNTMGVTENGGSLSVTNIALADIVVLDQYGDSFTSYYSTDGTKAGESANGFLTHDGTFYLFKGKEWAGTIGDKATDTTTSAGNTLITTSCAASLVYHVNEGVVIFGGENASAGIALASGFNVESGATLQLNGDVENGMSAKQALMSTLGGGEIVLATTATLSNEQTAFKGDLSISEQGVLNFGYVKGATSDISSLSSLELDGGTFNYNNIGSTIHNFTVSSNGGTMYVEDFPNVTTAWVNPAPIVFADTTTINGDFTYITEYKSYLTIEQLSGSGKFIISTETTNNRTDSGANVRIESISDFTGSIELNPEADGNNRVNVAINLNEDESLKVSQLTINDATKASVTLAGSGLYDLGSVISLGAGVTLSDNWTGTVKISGNESVINLNLSNFGNENSWVQLIGVKGYWAVGSSNALSIDTNLILGNETGDAVDAFTHTDGYSSTVYTINGDVKGTGNLKANRDKANSTVRTEFTGDISQWTGSYINEHTNCTSELAFSGKAKDINAALIQNGGKLNVTVDTDESAEFGNKVKVNNLTLKQSVTFSSGGENTVAGGLIIAADADKSISLTNDSTLIVNGNLTSNYGLSIAGGAGSVTLSGAQNTVNGALAITSGNGLTLGAGSVLTVNSAIQNDGNLDIQGTVNWNNIADLAVTYNPDELTRTTNGLGSGVISGLITGSGTLADNGDIAATVNGKNATLATGTGLVTVNNAVYYVMAPADNTDDGYVYSMFGDYADSSDVVYVGVHTYPGPIADEGANNVLGFYVGEKGILGIIGDSNTMSSGEILAQTQGEGTIILRAPGADNEQDENGMRENLHVIVNNKAQFTGNLSIATQLLKSSTEAEMTKSVYLHLEEGADISSFSSIEICNGANIVLDGIIERSESKGHINNLTNSGSGFTYLYLNQGGNEELVLGGNTTLRTYAHIPATDDNEGYEQGSLMRLIFNQNAQVTIENLTTGGDTLENMYWNTLEITSGYGTLYEHDEVVNGVVNIESFDYLGYIYLNASVDGSLQVNLNLKEGQTLYDFQYARETKVVGTQNLTITGEGTYVLSEGNSMLSNFGVLSTEFTEDGARIWQGTVEVNNLDASGTISKIQGIRIADYGNENSTIHFKGFKGYLTDDETAVKIKPDLILDNSDAMNAYEISGGYERQAHTYTGDISGDGDFVVSAAEGMSFNLEGDVSEWNGAMKVTGGTQTVNFSDKATVINADVLAANGATMNADISNTEAVTVNGRVKADGGTLNLSVNTAQGTTFTNEVKVTKISVGSGSTAKLEAASSAGNVSIGSYGEGKATLSKGLTIEENTVGHGYIADAMISHIQKAGTVELVEVSASNLYLYGGKQVQFHSTDSKNQFKFDNQVSYGSERVNEVVFTSEIFSGMILSEDGAQLTLTVDNAVLWGEAVQPDWTNVTIELKGFTIEKLANSAGDWDWDKFGLSFDPNSASVATLEAAAGLGTVSELLNADYDFVVYEQNASGLTIRMYNTPEPTTATLSMLALAALAARRRRASR